MKRRRCAASGRGRVETFPGIVVEVHGIRATVMRTDGVDARVRCRPPRDRQTPSVGDRVRVDKGRHGAVIVEIAERPRCLWRPQEQGRSLMATHVDRIVVIGAVSPPLRPGLVDRFLVAAEAAEIDAVLVINKSDLAGVEYALELLAPLAALGYPVLALSARTGDGLEALVEIVSHGLSVFVGHSGVGKSTLLNALIPGIELPTQELGAAGRGKHTTSVTTCHELGGRWPDAGLVVDTPGIRAFGLYGLELCQIADGFRELDPYKGACHFRNCLHESEPDCAVREAVVAGEVCEERYERYLRLLESVRMGTG